MWSLAYPFDDNVDCEISNRENWFLKTPYLLFARLEIPPGLPFSPSSLDTSVFSVKKDQFGNYLVSTTAPLNYEDRKFQTLTVSIDNQVQEIEVPVMDVNDNIPVFEKSIYEVDLLESIEANSPLLTVRATDLDSGDNGRITYSFQHLNQGE